MFDQLQERLSRTLRNLRGLGKIREENIQEALAEVRSSLLEADVHYRVVQSFVDSVRTKALGEEVLDRVEPGQQFVKIVHDELVRLLGETSPEIPRPKNGPLKILLTGLQGTGKTTTAAKLARRLRDGEGKRPLLVPADLARPAAREQLTQLGQANGIAVFSSDGVNSVDVCRDALRAVTLREVAADTVIFDTAGRLHVDEALMKELRQVREAVAPDLTLYVLDAMAGQDAVRSAEIFAREVGFDGVIVAKTDGDARGGAALSVRLVTGRPIYFLGTGEKIDALEPMHPDRFASRILGMGDILTLVERAQEAVDVKQAAKMAENLRKSQFTIEDFVEQIEGVRKMGSFEQLLEYLPGGAQMKSMVSQAMPEKELDRLQIIVRSMTPYERRHHEVIDGSRRKRIASGSGTSVQDVNRFLKQFLQARTMMMRLSRNGAKGFRRGGFPMFG